MTEKEEGVIMLRAKGVQPTKICGFDALRPWLDLFQAQDMSVYFPSSPRGGELRKVAEEGDYMLANQYGVDLIALNREDFAVWNKENVIATAVRPGVGRTPVKYLESDLELFKQAQYTPQQQHDDDTAIEWSTPQPTASRMRRLSSSETFQVQEPVASSRVTWKSMLAVIALGLALAVGFHMQATANGSDIVKLLSGRIQFENQFATEQRLAQQILEQTRKEILQAEADLARKRLEQEKELKLQEEVERKRLQEELESTRRRAKEELAEERKRLHQEHLTEEQRRKDGEAEQQRIAKEAEQQRIAKEAEQQRIAKEAEQQRITKEAERIAQEVEQERIAQKAEQQRQWDDEKRRLDKELEDELEIALAGFQEMERELETRRVRQLAEQAQEQQRLAEQMEREQLAIKRKLDELQQQRLDDYQRLQALQQRKRELQLSNPDHAQMLEQLEAEDERLRQERLERIRRTPLSTERIGDSLHEIVYGGKFIPKWIKQQLLQ
ncbi:hypothetical protein BASA81_012492 [Batrachochytrium salamandrivorans]|nr:hypothetical protein BASA81_012492 [Batrachochytrium salamandrivorans]